MATFFSFIYYQYMNARLKKILPLIYELKKNKYLNLKNLIIMKFHKFALNIILEVNSYIVF